MHRPIFAWLIALLLLAGCAETSAGRMAATQPETRDLSLLREGTPRALVVAQLGQPIWSGDRGAGRVDLFEFKQGYSRSAKTTRVVLHGVANVVTFGLWDIIGRPIETIYSGTTMRVEVAYDADDRVRSSREVRPEDATPRSEATKTR